MTFEQTGATEPHDRDEVAGRHSVRRVRLVLGLVLLAVVVAVVVDNRGNTRLGYVVGDARLPTVLVLAVAMLFGALVGWLIVHRPHHSHR